MGHLNTSLAFTVTKGAIDPNDVLGLRVNEPDLNTGFDFQLAMGIFDTVNFQTPIDLDMIGTVEAYLFRMTTNNAGGIDRVKVQLNTQRCAKSDIPMFQRLGKY